MLTMVKNLNVINGSGRKHQGYDAKELRTFANPLSGSTDAGDPAQSSVPPILIGA